MLSPQSRYAGNAAIPTQRAIPAALAPEFLCADGAQWFPWAEIEDAKPGAGQSFLIKHTFAQPEASVAMRVPFSNAYLSQTIERLRNAKPAGVRVDEIGRSVVGRPLWCIRVEDPSGLDAAGEMKTVVLFAREHATEHATSWAVLGALERLIDGSAAMDELRRHVRFLIVPLEDPDGVAVSRFNNLTDNWDDPKNNARLTEVLAYSRYFRDYADQGHTLDVAVSFHNVEANEAPNWMTPFAQPYFRKTTVAFNGPLFESLRASGYTVSSATPGGSGVMGTRLYGWLALHLGAMDLAYEVNDRAPEHRLSTQQLKHMGAIFVTELGKWLESDAGEARHAQARESLDKRAQKRTAELAAGQPQTEEEKRFNLLMKGF